jgi:hypothetical protein
VESSTLLLFYEPLSKDRELGALVRTAGPYRIFYDMQKYVQKYAVRNNITMPSPSELDRCIRALHRYHKAQPRPPGLDHAAYKQFMAEAGRHSLSYEHFLYLDPALPGVLPKEHNAARVYAQICKAFEQTGGKNPQPQNLPKKGEPMSTNIKIETRTFVNGTDVRNYSDAQLIALIEQAEAEIKRLSSVVTTSSKISARIEELRAGALALARLLDGPSNPGE